MAKIFLGVGLTLFILVLFFWAVTHHIDLFFDWLAG